MVLGDLFPWSFSAYKNTTSANRGGHLYKKYRFRPIDFKWWPFQGQVGKNWKMNFRPLFFSAGCGDPCGTKGVLAYSRNLGEKHRKWVERKRRKTQIRSRMASWGVFFAENGNVLFHLLKHSIVLLWLVGMYMSIQMYIYGYIWYTSICVFNINVDCLTSTFSWCIVITGTLFWKVIFPLKKMRGGPFQCFL